MPPDKLISRIKAVLNGDTDSFEIQSLAREYADLVARLRDRLDQCAALIRSGNDYAALQVAESAPPILDTAAKLAFAESPEWLALCRRQNVPWPSPLDTSDIDLVNNLYGRQISESHPLYRDYRQAIRERDDLRAITILSSIIRINPDDTNARREFIRLGEKVRESQLARLETLLAEGKKEEAFDLASSLETLRIPKLADAPSLALVRVMRAKREAERALAEVSAALDEADALRNSGNWRETMPVLGRCHALVREHRLELDATTTGRLSELAAWAAECNEADSAASARAESARRARNVLSDLVDKVNREAAMPRAKALELEITLERAVAAAAEFASDKLTPAVEAPSDSEIEAGRRALAKLRARLRRRNVLIAAGAAVVMLAAAATGAFLWLENAENSARAAATARLLALPSENNISAAETFLRSLNSGWERNAAHAEAKQKLAAWVAGHLEKAARITAAADALAARPLEGASPETFQLDAAGIAKLRADLDGMPADKLSELAEHVEKAAARHAQIREALENGRIKPFSENLARLERAVGDAAAITVAANRAAALEKCKPDMLQLRSEAAALRPLLAAGAIERWEALEKRVESIEGETTALALADKTLSGVRDLAAYYTVLRSIAAKSPTGAFAALLESEPEMRAPAPKVFSAGIARLWNAAAAASASPASIPFRPEKPDERENAIAAKIIGDNTLLNIQRHTLRRHPRSDSAPDGKIWSVGAPAGDRAPYGDGYSLTTTLTVIAKPDGAQESRSFRFFRSSATGARGDEIRDSELAPESRFLREFATFYNPSAQRINEPLIAALDRVRAAPSPSPIFKAWLEQELLKIIENRPDEWGFLFSPTAIRLARELRAITQDAAGPYEWLFPDRWTDRRPALRAHYENSRKFSCYDEAKAWLAVFQKLATPNSGFVYAGHVGAGGALQVVPEQRARLRGLLVGVGADGHVARAFYGERPIPVPETLSVRLSGLPFVPYSPVIMLNHLPAEAAELAKFPATFPPPAQGWNFHVLNNPK